MGQMLEPPCPRPEWTARGQTPRVPQDAGAERGLAMEERSQPVTGHGAARRAGGPKGGNSQGAKGTGHVAMWGGRRLLFGMSSPSRPPGRSQHGLSDRGPAVLHPQNNRLQLLADPTPRMGTLGSRPLQAATVAKSAPERGQVPLLAQGRPRGSEGDRAQETRACAQRSRPLQTGWRGMVPETAPVFL